MSETKNSEGSAVKQAVKLPLVSSTLQMVVGVYMGAKRRYPLLGIVGGITELSVRSISTAASQRAAPLLKRLEPEIEAVNGYALVGLEQLEKTFPIFHQSADEVIERAKEIFFIRLGDVQTRVNEELDSMADRWDRIVKFTWDVLEAAQASSAGQALTSSLDELLTRSEEAVDYYLPLPPILQREWEIRVQSFEDEDQEENDDADNDAEPRMWTRIRSLLLFLYLQMYHRFLQLKEKADSVLTFLEEAADVVGLTGLLESVWSLLQMLLLLYTAQVQRVEALRSLLLAQFSAGMQALKELPLTRQLMTLPAQVRTVMDDLLELGQILIQLLINTTPLYDLVQQSSDQNVTDFELPDGATRRSSANSLFLKAMDGRPRRRRSLYARYRRSSSSSSPLNPSPALSPGPAPAASSPLTPASGSTLPPASANTLSPAPASTLTPAPAPAPAPAPSLSPVPIPDLPQQDPMEDQDEVSISAKAQDKIPDSESSETQDELSEPEPTEAQDESSDPEPTEAQDESSDPEAQDELPDPEPTEFQNYFQDQEQTEATAPDGRKDSLKKDGQLAGTEFDSPGLSSPNIIRRRSSAREVLFSPIMQFVTQSQRAFEYLSSASYSEDQAPQVMENSEQ